tara:strand:- start:2919 stop:3443 length:525 start_codon:yes stop_codon:yes gene_type:complete
MPGLKKKELRTEDDLTLKQKKFVDIYVKNWGNITKADALKEAGYECKNSNDYSVIASRLTNRKLNPHVVKYLDRIYKEECAKYEGDNLRRYKRLERIALNAEADKQYAAAINAEYRSGQLAGQYVDRREVKVTGLEGMSREELEKKLKELSNKIDGYNAKTIEIVEDTKQIDQS